MNRLAPVKPKYWLIAALALSNVLVVMTLVSAEQWSSWRGPANNGVSQRKNLPVSWSRTENVLWRLPLPGPAGATPVIWDDRIFCTSVAANGKDLLLLCVEDTGKILWTRKVGTGNEPVRGDEGNFASPSPSTDGQHVWTMMANGLLACYDWDGNRVWHKDLQKVYGAFDIQFGLPSTPVLDGDRLYLQLIHGPWNKDPHSGLVIALDKKTGDQVWKHDRVTDAVDECKHSYASPVLYRDDEREFLLTHGADYVIAHRLDDGREIWRRGNLNPKGSYNSTLRFVSSPGWVPGLIVVPTAKKSKTVALRPDGKGDITESAEFNLWTFPRNTPDVPSPVIHDGVVYLCRENGNLLAIDAGTGRQLFEQRTTRDRHRASPVVADGNIYLTARNGVVTVVKAGRDFEIVSRNDIGEHVTSSPAVADGRIYLRSFEALYAIESE